MRRPEDSRSWWDKEADSAGRPIRKDVRAAAHAIWKRACALSGRIMGDTTQAPDLMEASVDRISRYLDRREVPVDALNVQGLLMLTFRRALERSAAKLRRLELRGGTGELSIHLVDNQWPTRTDSRVDLARFISYLEPQTREIMALWVAGYGWEEIATIKGSSAPALRNAFWRDVHRVKAKMEIDELREGAD